MKIRKALQSDLKNTLLVESLAFGNDKEAELVNELLRDPSANPSLSLLAFQNEQAIGHILFTKARVTKTKEHPSAALLAPLAVIPDFQRKGIGGELIKEGLRLLSQSETDLVFVLGHPEYYPRHGFKPAGIRGFEAPYPIPAKDANAWMVQELKEGMIGNVRGKIICADALNQPQYWQE